MIARFHDQTDAAELLEVQPLLSLERVRDEEWNDAFDQIFRSPDSVTQSIAVVRPNHTAAEVLLQGMEDLHIALVLHYGELR